MFELSRPILNIVVWDDWDYVRFNSQNTNAIHLQKCLLYLNKIILSKVYKYFTLK